MEKKVPWWFNFDPYPYGAVAILNKPSLLRTGSKGCDRLAHGAGVGVSWQSVRCAGYMLDLL